MSKNIINVDSLNKYHQGLKVTYLDPLEKKIDEFKSGDKFLNEVTRLDEKIDENVGTINSQLAHITTLITMYGDTTEDYQRAIDYAISNKLNIEIPQKGIHLTNGLVIDVKNSYGLKIFGSGVITSSNNIDDLITIVNLENGSIDLTFGRGGNRLSNALVVTNIRNTNIKVKGNFFDGTLFYNKANYANNTYSYGNYVEYIQANRCGRAVKHGVDINNHYTDAFGKYASIWDYLCLEPSIFENCYDITIGHYENLFQDAEQNKNSLEFKNCGSININVLAIGGKCKNLCTISNAININITDLFMVCQDIENKITNGLLIENCKDINIQKANVGKANKGIEIIDTPNFTLNNMYPISCNNPLIVNGKNIELADQQHFTYSNKDVQIPSLKQIFFGDNREITLTHNKNISSDSLLLNNKPILVTGKELTKPILERVIKANESPYTFTNNNSFNVMLILQCGGLNNVTKIEYILPNGYIIIIPVPNCENAVVPLTVVSKGSVKVTSNGNFVLVGIGI